MPYMPEPGDTLEDMNEAMAAEIEMLRATIHEAGLQIQYLHEKFRQTGSGNAVLAKIATVLDRP